MTRVFIVDVKSEIMVHFIPIYSKADVLKVTKELLQREEDQPDSVSKLILINQGSIKVIGSVDEIPIPARPGGAAYVC